MNSAPLTFAEAVTEASFKVVSKVHSEILLGLFSKQEHEPSTWGISPRTSYYIQPCPGSYNPR